jgi:hypothetical protein
MKNKMKRLDIIEKTVETSSHGEWIVSKHPSWVVSALIGAGLITTISLGACSSEKEKTTVNNPPPRKAAVDTKPGIPKNSPAETKPQAKPAKPKTPPPMDQEVPIYGIR